LFKRNSVFKNESLISMTSKIVVTDGFTLNPGDLSWKPFEEFGKVDIFERTRPDQLLQRCSGASVIITNKTPVSSEIIHAHSDLKIIAVTATGYNVVDIGAAKQKGIIVCNVPGYGTDSVAQHTFALLLELTNHVGKNATSVNKGDWSRSKDWCYVDSPITELSGKILGIVGYGKIGQRVAAIGRAFGMEVIYSNPSTRRSEHQFASLEELFKSSDVVSLHCPLNETNHSFVNELLLSLMKPSAFLINTARGQLINEADLANALMKGRLAGAALDVLAKEPPSSENPLIGLPNCIITPHNAWLSVEARNRIMNVTFENVKAALAGSPQNVVS
jgi:glycerate dehydrogenase